MYDFHVILGCFGLRVDDFVNCAGVENSILGVNTGLYNYNEMIEYFDSCRLFDRPMFDMNAIRHFVHNLHDRYDQVTKPLWPAKKYELYQKFIIDHRHCGLYVRLELPQKAVEEPEQTLIKPAKDLQVTSKDSTSNRLRLIRGRR